MFTNLFNHLLTIVGMIILIAVATVIIAFIGSFTYVMVKHFIDAVRNTANNEKSSSIDMSKITNYNKEK